MKILRAYKTELAPDNVQRTMFLRHAGAARWAYNWGLRQKIDAYKETGKSPSAIDLHRKLNKLKDMPKEDGGVPWMRQSSKCAPQEALRDLDKAFGNFFRRCKQGAARKGFPRFKGRKRGIGGFRLTGAVRATETHIQLPRIGEVRLKEHGYLPSGAKVLSAAVSEQAGRWFVSLQVEQQVPDPAPRPEHVVGVDVGVKALAVTSDGEVFDNPKALKAGQQRLRILQKAVSRKVKGSKNRKKAVAKVRRQHYRISNIRRDCLHKTSSAITKLASTVVLETLNVGGMLKNRRLSKAVSDASMAELHRQIEYKARWQGVVVLKADRWFASSKMCSGCGHIKQDLTLGERVFGCEACGEVIDRDLNATINLKNLAGSSPVSACRPGGAGLGRKTQVKPPVGQELSADRGHVIPIGSV